MGQRFVLAEDTGDFVLVGLIGWLVISRCLPAFGPWPTLVLLSLALIIRKVALSIVVEMLLIVIVAIGVKAYRLGSRLR
jgi:hypothetical protein